MTKRPSVPRLSERELEIMDMLWSRDAATLSEAHAALGRAVGYTTVQTQLNRLVEKGAVSRSDDRPARYRAAISPEAVGKAQAGQIARQVGSGSLVPLVAHLVKDRSITRVEFAELKRLIDEAQQKLSRRKPKEDGT